MFITAHSFCKLAVGEHISQGDQGQDSHEVAVKMSSEVTVSKGSTRTGGSTSKGVESHTWQMNANCWQDV